MRSAVEALYRRGVLLRIPGGPYYNLGRYVLDLSDVVRWRAT
jgi:hypothetical protein